MDEYRTRAAPGGLYGHLRTERPELRWSTFCQGYMHAGSIGAEVVVVVDGGLNPRGKHSVRWVAPKQERQPFMFRRTLPEAMALAERVLRLKGLVR